MFKVAVIGGSGLLGRAIVQELNAQSGWAVSATAFRRAWPGLTALDIRDSKSVDRFIDDTRPDAIVIAAAERRPDICEHEPLVARALNVDAVRAIANAARRCGAWTLSISTDYVFDGSRPPYLPADPPHPINAYGTSKLEGERALMEASTSSCVLRLPLLYGPIVDWQESAVTSLVPAIAASASGLPDGKTAVMDAWATRYPTYTPDVAVLIRQLLERRLQGVPVCGVTHWSGDEPMTKYDIALSIASALGIQARISPQHHPTDATPRPRDCHLDSSTLDAMGLGQRTSFAVAIKKTLDAFPWQGSAGLDGG
ncbi:dTDP-4-dehydrorhamnose reductase family protein [Paraburkholderia phosphatilytica]|uniref:dTDP-4-dehydrorhamnose reductase family protein n=1 Tax=Paraburkholderia phosphatilytica TaxID=2282883 RepID=UPI000E5269C9|nr:SDR family oxidoreductase [Paraburkholderia phosphatilytica]